jgi:hypothetical protein
MSIYEQKLVSKYNLVHILLVLFVKLFGKDSNVGSITKIFKFNNLKIWYFDNINHIIIEKNRKSVYDHFTKQE